MKKIVGCLLAFLLISVVVSCANNSQSSEVQTVSYSLTETYSGITMTHYINIHKDGTGDYTVAFKGGALDGKSVTCLKGSHAINPNEDGTYTVTITHIQEKMPAGDFELDDESTWGALIDVPASFALKSFEVTIQDNGKKLATDMGFGSPVTFYRE